MSRWDEPSFDNFGYEKTSDHEEARLLKKFDDYRDLEKKELEKRNPQKTPKEEKVKTKNGQFFFVTIIQAIAIVGFTASLIFFEMVNSKIMNLVLVATLTILAGEIVIISMFLRKKSNLNHGSFITGKTKSEFDVI
jgi:hypothetical protein